MITALMMPWLTGPKIAKELLLGADDRVTAERALAIGLINRIVPEGEGLAAAQKMALTRVATHAHGHRRYRGNTYRISRR